MKIFRSKLFVGLGVLFTVFAVLALIIANQPGEFTITRAQTIAAAPQEVFEHIHDFKKFQNWSPWAKLDPNVVMTYEGPPTGPGTKFKWSGNEQVGEGQMTLVESKPPEQAKMKLEFVRPFEDTADVQFDLKPEGAGSTNVSWSMSGKRGFIEKAMCMVMDMDKMIGTDFEKGLASLKSLVEGQKASSPAPASP